MKTKIDVNISTREHPEKRFPATMSISFDKNDFILYEEFRRLVTELANKGLVKYSNNPTPQDENFLIDFGRIIDIKVLLDKLKEHDLIVSKVGRNFRDIHQEKISVRKLSNRAKKLCHQVFP